MRLRPVIDAITHLPNDIAALHPAEHLKQFSGTLQADAYAGYEAIYQARANTAKPIVEAGCWGVAGRQAIA